LVSILFFYSTKKLSNALFEKYFYKYKIQQKEINIIFYIFSLNVFVLVFGMIVGTELLALSFFQLFITYFILNKNSGHWLALAFLSRYNFFIFISFLFLNRNIKKILKNLALFILVILPWIIFNKIKWGNWFTSIADSFYLNIFSRLDRIEIFQFSSLISITNWFLPFVILGLLVPLIIMLRSKNRKILDYKYEILFLFIFLFFLYDLYTIPFKITRYLFNMVLPVAFFSTLGAILLLKNLKKKSWQKKFIMIIFFGFLISLIAVANHSFKMDDSDKMYIEATNSIKSLELSECQILSPHWVPVNYYSGNVRFLNYTIKEGLSKNEIMLIFYKYPTMDDKFNQEELGSYPQLIKTETYIIIANKNTSKENCIKTRESSSPLVEEPCEMLSNKFNSKIIKNAFLKICKLIN